MNSPPEFLIVDGHEDLSMNALADGRDYLTSAHAIRAGEADAGYENPNGICMLGLADWLAARVAVIFATVQTIPRWRANPGELSYATIDGAHQQALAHLDLYRRWATTSPQVELVTTRQELHAVTDSWANPDAPDSERRVGLVLLMENADPIRSPDEVAFWAAQGIRVGGPAWHANRYSGSTEEGGPLTDLGRDLLTEMARAGMALDLTHMSEEACLESLATYDGPIVATHAHSRRTKDTSRLLSDSVIEGIVARDGIVGVLPLNWALALRGGPPTARKQFIWTRSSTRSMPSARSRAMRSTSASAVISTGAKAPSRPPPRSTRSPTCRSSRRLSPIADSPRTTSQASWAKTGSAFSAGSSHDAPWTKPVE